MRRLNRRALLVLVAATACRLDMAATACGQTRPALNGGSAAAAPTPRFAGARNYDPGSSPAAVAIADVTGDGTADVVTANAPGATVSVFVNRGDGRLRSGRNYAAAAESSSVAIADLNGDRKPDLAIGSWDRSGAIAVLLNRGDGSFGLA